jgi:sugar lactone lactonase YvrE
MPRLISSTSRSLAVVAFAAVVPGCVAGDASADTATSNASRAVRVGVITDFPVPESVRYDPDQDIYFVSNIVGYGSVKDGIGLIHRASAAPPMHAEIFVQSGVNGVQLDAPKGMAIQGDTLWVADIDVLRGFHRRTGQPVGTIDFRPFRPTMLNDVAIGPDGTLRVTDTGIIMSEKGVLRPGGEKIFAVGPGRTISLVAEGVNLSAPNGITWDAAGKRWIVVSFSPVSSPVYVLSGSTPSTRLATGKGKLDGVEALSDGRILYSSWSDSSIHMIVNGHDQQIARNLPEPADIGVDEKRGVVAVPLAMMGRIEFLRIPKGRQ